MDKNRDTTPKLHSILENIPDELKGYKQWVIWRRSQGKNSKRPYNAVTGNPAASDNPASWSSFEQAQAAVLKGSADGVGFVLTDDDPFTFIDLDNVIVNGIIEPWADELIKRLNSNTEISQSDRGIHILIKGRKPGSRSKSERVEIYDQGHYFALTGKTWNGAPLTIEERQVELSQLYNDVFTDGAACGDIDSRKLAGDLVLDREASPPEEKLRVLLGNEKLRDTWEHNRDFPSLSEYDMALTSSAVDNGWYDQEIADLLIAFRRRYGEGADLEKALRTDYVARTITKARNSETAERRCEITDVGNAKRLALRHGENLRYCHPMKKWLTWDGIRWKMDDVGQIIEMAKETLRSIYHQAASIKDDTERVKLIKAIRQHENNTRIKAMIELAQSIPGIPILPRQMDTDPWKLNVLNGTVDLMTGELLPHNRDDLITKLAPVEYVQGARSDLFEKFLTRVLPDKDVRDFVQRAAGYTLYGKNEEEILLFIYGPPASGKSTFIAAVGAALGDYAAMTDFASFLKRVRTSGGPRADIARLAGRRLVISMEVDEGARMDETMVNQLTGMDVVTVRHLYQESFEFLPQFTIWMAANCRPQIDNPDGGIWRRIREIPFDQVVPEQEQDRKLKQKLCESEHGAAVLNWLVGGCLAWREKGLNVPEAVRGATEDYRFEMDHVRDFLEDCTVTGKHCWEYVNLINSAYTEWCHRNRINPLGRKAFNSNLRNRGLEQRSDGQRRRWEGILLNDDPIGEIRRRSY